MMQTMTRKGIILAGGEGTRLSPLTKQDPSLLIEITLLINNKSAQCGCDTTTMSVIEGARKLLVCLQISNSSPGLRQGSIDNPSTLKRCRFPSSQSTRSIMLLFRIQDM